MKSRRLNMVCDTSVQVQPDNWHFGHFVGIIGAHICQVPSGNLT